MSKARIDDLEASILSTISGDAAISAYIPANQVQALSQLNMDFASEQIVILPPAVLVYYEGGSYDPKTLTWKLNVAEERFVLLAVARNLRGAKQAKEGGVGTERGAYDILEDLKAVFAGKKLTPATDVDVFCRLASIGFEGVSANGSFVYALHIVARGLWDNAP